MSLHLNRNRGQAPANALVRLVAINVATGVGLGFVVAAAIVVTDLNGLGTLLRQTDQVFVGASLLVGGFVALAVSGAVATAVMTIPSGENGRGPGGRGLLAPSMAAHWLDLIRAWRPTVEPQPRLAPVRARRSDQN